MRSQLIHIATVSLVAMAVVVGGAAGTAHGDGPIACPVDGASTYDDSFGWARSGGRRHQGIDIGAEVAQWDGVIRDNTAQHRR